MQTLPSQQEMYQALVRSDRSYDGIFFIGVLTTGIFCRPLDNGHRPPEWITSLLRRVDLAPTARVRDADLRAMSIDPSRVRRYFRKHYGMTFHAYHRARRMGLALSDVRRGRDLGRVALRHGYDSPSGYGGGLWRKEWLLEHEKKKRN